MKSSFQNPDFGFWNKKMSQKVQMDILGQKNVPKSTNGHFGTKKCPKKYKWTFWDKKMSQKVQMDILGQKKDEVLNADKVKLL